MRSSMELKRKTPTSHVLAPARLREPAWGGAEFAAGRVPDPGFGHDFGRIGAAPHLDTVSCPVLPRACPFGGACHTCPATGVGPAAGRTAR